MEPIDHMRIVDLASRFATLADVGTLDEVAELLTPDVVWEMAGVTWGDRDAVISGLKAIRDSGHAGPGTKTRHLVTNVQVGPEVDGSARVHSYFLFLGEGTPPAVQLFGEYRDVVRRHAGNWRIAARIVAV